MRELLENNSFERSLRMLTLLILARVTVHTEKATRKYQNGFRPRNWKNGRYLCREKS